MLQFMFAKNRVYKSPMRLCSLLLMLVFCLLLFCSLTFDSENCGETTNRNFMPGKKRKSSHFDGPRYRRLKKKLTQSKTLVSDCDESSDCQNHENITAISTRDAHIDSELPSTSTSFRFDRHYGIPASNTTSLDTFHDVIALYGLDQSYSESSADDENLPEIYKQLNPSISSMTGRPGKGSKYKPFCFERLQDGPVCEFCGAFRFSRERKGICCMSGKLAKVPLPPDPPTVIAEFYSNNHFLDNIRSYNNVLALASMGCEEVRAGGYNPIIKIHGKVHHFVGSLLPNPGMKPMYAQLYFCDTNNELRNRSALHDKLNPDIILKLQECLHEVNPHVKAIRYAASRSDESDSLQVVLRSDGTKMTELPTEDGVAGLIDVKSAGHFNVVLETKGGEIKRINEMNHLYDPLHYVLLFPYGGSGYNLNMVNSARKSVSAMKYCRYLVQVRKPEVSGNYLVRSRRLFHQFVIDQFAKQESYRMTWYRMHQRELRAEKYSGLVDAGTNDDSCSPGKRIILPPSHYGSPRWYSEVFQDCMAIVRRHGKPDLFITMTCNPKWPEIVKSLHEGESAQDRPDITCRVFNIKHEELIKDLTKKRLFGKVVAFVSMKEDQKRGLPHCHILVTLDKDSKPRNPEDVDKIISAEIPDKDTDPELFGIITTHNIHGPCGGIGKDARCMKKNSDGTCSCMRRFPKKANNDGTVFVENAYPQYRRRDVLHGGHVTYRTVDGKTFTIDNHWVVPYNRDLSTKYNCHINVESVSTVGAVKYICLYLTKGTDKTLYSLLTEERNGVVDEIMNFSVARYISSPEAIWRAYEFDILKKYPPVEKLAIHLPDQQTVVFDPKNVEHIVSDGPPVTSLTAFFQLNAASEEARNFVYPEICQYYRYVSNKWVKRQRKRGSKKPGGPLSDTIGRMPVINPSPKQMELYYLRLLLHHIRGPKCYDDLRTVNGTLHLTFRDACLALGLISDDTECEQALNEAASIRFGACLRQLFATLLLYGELADPVHLWENHKGQLTEDIAYRNNRANEPIEADYAEALHDIQRHLSLFEMTLGDFGIDCPAGVGPLPTLDDSFDISFLADLYTTNLSQMTIDQRDIFDRVMESVDNGLGKCFLLNAAGGTGKTFIVTTILAAIRARKQVAIATAVSGIAATLLPNGRTLHSKLCVPVDFDEYSMCSISSNSRIAAELRECCLLVVDEVTMAHRHIFEAVDRSLRDITKVNQLFGGITVLLSGDWRQILPVVKHGAPADIINSCLKNSYIWPHAEKLSLYRNMRLANDNTENQEFAKYLLDVGDDKVPPIEAETPDMIPIPAELKLQNNCLSSLCDFVYDDLCDKFASPEWISSRGVLCPTNEAVEEVNGIMINRFPGSLKIYRSADFLVDDSLSFQYPIEYLNSITPSGMPQHELAIKVGSPVMLLRNLDPANHHCNGTRYVITQMHEHVLEVAIASGPKVGQRRFIPRISLQSSDKSLPFQMKRVQFPLKVCFGLTMNKSQGQSFSKVGVYLKRDVFSHGQLYVALSRVRNSYALKVLPCESNPDRMRNIVYKDIVASSF